MTNVFTSTETVAELETLRDTFLIQINEIDYGRASASRYFHLHTTVALIDELIEEIQAAYPPAVTRPVLCHCYDEIPF